MEAYRHIGWAHLSTFNPLALRMLAESATDAHWERRCLVRQPAATSSRLEIGHVGSPPRLRRGGRGRSLRRGGARSLRKPPMERFASQTGIFGTKRSNDDFRATPSDHSRAAARPLSLRGTSPPGLRRGARKTSNSQSGWRRQPGSDGRWPSGRRDVRAPRTP